MFEMLEPRRLFPRIRSTARRSLPTPTAGRSSQPRGQGLCPALRQQQGLADRHRLRQRDQVAIIQVTGIAPSDADGDQASGVFQELLQKPPAPFSAVESYIVAAGNMKLENFQGLLERSQASLADAQASLQNSRIARRRSQIFHVDAAGGAFSSVGSASQIIDATERVNDQQEQVDTLQHEVDLMQSGALTRVQLTGVYDVYIESSILSNVISRRWRRGNDDVSIGTNVAQKASIVGGTGADKLTTGASAPSSTAAAETTASSAAQTRRNPRWRHGRRSLLQPRREVQILARKDGDQVIVNNTSVMVTQTGVFGAVTLTSTYTTWSTAPRGRSIFSLQIRH